MTSTTNTNGTLGGNTNTSPVGTTNTSPTTAPTSASAADIASATTPTGAVRFAPPTMHNPTIVDLNKTGAQEYFHFAPNEDVIFIAPTSTRTLARLATDGGHNIILVGGNYVPDAGSHSASGTLQFRQFTGEAYVEGVHVDNSKCTTRDGIDVNGANVDTKVTVQNALVEGCHSFRVGLHADTFQTQGPVGDIRLFNYTGESNYQGIFIAPQAATKSAYLENVNLKYGTGGEKASYELWFLDNASEKPFPITMKNVYVTERAGQHAESSSVWPQIGMGSLSAVRTGNDISWPHLPVTGHVTVGTPPGGDFAKAGSVGLNYHATGVAPTTSAATPVAADPTVATPAPAVDTHTASATPAATPATTTHTGTTHTGTTTPPATHHTAVTPAAAGTHGAAHTHGHTHTPAAPVTPAHPATGATAPAVNTHTVTTADPTAADHSPAAPVVSAPVTDPAAPATATHTVAAADPTAVAPTATAPVAQPPVATGTTPPAADHTATPVVSAPATPAATTADATAPTAPTPATPTLTPTVAHHDGNLDLSALLSSIRQAGPQHQGWDPQAYHAAPAVGHGGADAMQTLVHLDHTATHMDHMLTDMMAVLSGHHLA